MLNSLASGTFNSKFPFQRSGQGGRGLGQEKSPNSSIMRQPIKQRYVRKEGGGFVVSEKKKTSN